MLTADRRSAHPARPARPPRGALFYSGPSLLTGDPIVGLITGLQGHTINPKTGSLLQTWILHAALSPLDAIRTGLDSAICGDCDLRGHLQDGRYGVHRGCYVTACQAPTSVWKAWGKGLYPRLDYQWLQGRGLRLGAYGDPAAIPSDIWSALVTASGASWTGYTHQWRRPDANTQALRPLCMASVRTEAEAALAQAAGWRTFRIRADAHAPLAPHEVVCPASAEAGHRTTCASCSLCQGASLTAHSIVIAAHGTGAYYLKQEARATTIIQAYAYGRMLPMLPARASH